MLWRGQAVLGSLVASRRGECCEGGVSCKKIRMWTCAMMGLRFEIGNTAALKLRHTLQNTGWPRKFFGGFVPNKVLSSAFEKARKT